MRNLICILLLTFGPSIYAQENSDDTKEKIASIQAGAPYFILCKLYRSSFQASIKFEFELSDINKLQPQKNENLENRKSVINN